MRDMLETSSARVPTSTWSMHDVQVHKEFEKAALYRIEK